MKTRNLMIGLGVAAALAAGIGAYSYTAFAQGGPGYGPGMMGGGFGPRMMSGDGPCMMQDFGPGGDQGYGPGYHMRGWGGGPGMMRQGYGPGYGPQGNAQDNQAVNLSTDDVKARMERWLAWRQNSHLKVGNVKEKDADTISADIVTKDNSLVERFIVNRHSGFVRRDNS